MSPFPLTLSLCPALQNKLLRLHCSACQQSGNTRNLMKIQQVASAAGFMWTFPRPCLLPHSRVIFGPSEVLPPDCLWSCYRDMEQCVSVCVCVCVEIKDASFVSQVLSEECLLVTIHSVAQSVKYPFMAHLSYFSLDEREWKIESKGSYLEVSKWLIAQTRSWCLDICLLVIVSN